MTYIIVVTMPILCSEHGYFTALTPQAKVCRQGDIDHLLVADQ